MEQNEKKPHRSRCGLSVLQRTRGGVGPGSHSRARVFWRVLLNATGGVLCCAVLVEAVFVGDAGLLLTGLKARVV